MLHQHLVLQVRRENSNRRDDLVMIVMFKLAMTMTIIMMTKLSRNRYCCIYCCYLGLTVIKLWYSGGGAGGGHEHNDDVIVKIMIMIMTAIISITIIMVMIVIILMMIIVIKY